VSDKPVAVGIPSNGYALSFGSTSRRNHAASGDGAVTLVVCLAAIARIITGDRALREGLVRRHDGLTGASALCALARPFELCSFTRIAAPSHCVAAAVELSAIRAERC
jgi:hypothetical protein